MNKKRMLILGAVVAVFVGAFALSTGTSYAQGSGGRGAGGRGFANGNMTAAGSAAAANQWSQGGAFGQQARQGQRLQIHDPALLNNGLQSDPLAIQQGRGGFGQGQYRNQTAALGANIYATMEPFTGELPADVADALLAGLADEYNAYAVYEAVIAQFGPVAPFTSILNAEASHAAALEAALTYYGVDFSGVTPVVGDLDLTTVADACALGAEAEIANFELYDSWLNTVSDYPDLVQIFTNLRDASEFNHLPAFENCAG